MSNTTNTIGVNIVIPTGKTQQDMESLTKTINKYQEALEKALRYNTPITINGIQHTREEVQGLQNDLIALRDLQRQSRIDVSNKEANKQALTETKEKINLEKEYQKELQKTANVVSKGKERDALQKQDSFYNRAPKSAKDSALVFEPNLEKLERATMPFRQQLSLLKDEQQSLWKQMQVPGIETSKLDGLKKSYADVTNEIKKTTLQQGEFNKAIGNSESYLGSFSQKFRKVLAA